ncbi:MULTISPECIES: CBS domain-containing protein [Lichenihabitans]|uniref:CBS domain-containing protein n=1 Tax=Lichenihabitans TaxID=2723776 RepID=UPI001035E177|nr:MULTISPECIES: CBS domain-containing protein [Lichenihabitans]UDL94710.1 CBS domain-containing protein [Lichenihabitans sp. PAMC28606]
MNLSHILANKGQAVITTAPHRTLGEACTVLSEKGIGALVVTSADREVLGILSERDIIRALAKHGSAVLDQAVSAFMTAKVVTATEHTSVTAAMEQMTDGRFRHMPIVNEGRLSGLISIGDVVKHRLELIEHEKQSMIDYIGTA